MDKLRIKALIEVLKEHKSRIDDGYTDIGHISLGIEIIEVLINLLERSDNSDYAKCSDLLEECHSVLEDIASDHPICRKLAAHFA